MVDSINNKLNNGVKSSNNKTENDFNHADLELQNHIRGIVDSRSQLSRPVINNDTQITENQLIKPNTRPQIRPAAGINKSDGLQQQLQEQQQLIEQLQEQLQQLQQQFQQTQSSITPSTPPLLGDLDFNGFVDQLDLDILDNALELPNFPNYHKLDDQQKTVADINHDGKVDTQDYMLLSPMVFKNLLNSIKPGSSIQEDINNDGIVNYKDMEAFIKAYKYLSAIQAAGYQPTIKINNAQENILEATDFNKDGRVDLKDFVSMREKFNTLYISQIKDFTKKIIHGDDVQSSQDSLYKLLSNLTSLDENVLRKNAVNQIINERKNIDGGYFFDYQDIIKAWTQPDMALNYKGNSYGGFYTQVIDSFQEQGSSEKLIGDLNFDGSVDKYDTDIFFRSIYAAPQTPFYIELSDKQKEVADINGDGKVEDEDRSLLQALVAKNSFDSIKSGSSIEGDINNDGKVNYKDMEAYLYAENTINLVGGVLDMFGVNADISSETIEATDLNKDGVVNSKDLSKLENIFDKIYLSQIDKYMKNITSNVDVKNSKESLYKLLSELTLLNKNDEKAKAVNEIINKKIDLDGSGEVDANDAILAWETPTLVTVEELDKNL